MENLGPQQIETTKLKILFFIRYFGDAFFYSFFQVFLAYKGLTASQIGIITAITPFTSIIANPFWQFFSKDANTNRKIIRVLTLIEALIIIFFTKVNSFEIIAILTCTLAIVGSPFYSLLDGFSATFCDINNKVYSKIRIYGSIAYVFSTTIGGFLITRIGYSWVFMICGLFFSLTSILLWIVKPINLENQTHETLKRDYKSLFRNKRFYLYILFYVLTVTISNLGDTFFGVFLTKIRGLDEGAYGLYYSYIVIMECLIMFILGKWGSKIPDWVLFVMFGGFFFTRLFAAGLDLPTPLIIAFGGARGLGYGTMLYINYKYIIKIVKVQNVTAAILILAIVHNAFLGLFNLLGGKLIDLFSYQSVFLVLSLIIITATIGVIIKHLTEKKIKIPLN